MAVETKAAMIYETRPLRVSGVWLGLVSLQGQHREEFCFRNFSVWVEVSGVSGILVEASRQAG